MDDVFVVTAIVLTSVISLHWVVASAASVSSFGSSHKRQSDYSAAG